jgi:hypothetical protein
MACAIMADIWEPKPVSLTNRASPYSVSRKYPKFRDKIAGADFPGEFLSQKSGAKVKLARQTFATLGGYAPDPSRTMPSGSFA